MSGTSLLAQLYPYFRGSQEDVATASLRYIISSDQILNIAFTRIISNKLNISIEDELQYECQIIGKSDEKERPDISGFDGNGDEQILCESKFYAALTSNQPNTYIKRLIKEKGKGLVFICPELRRKSLWNEVLNRAKNEFKIVEISEECIEIQGIRMGILSWIEILDVLSDVALKNNVNQMDIMQLRGYCEKIDSDAFVPFEETDFGIENAKKYERHVILVDAVFEALKVDSSLEIWTGEGKHTLNATPQRNGYSRYFKLNGYGASLVMDTSKWKNINSLITPYWIKICKVIDGKWKMDEACKKALRSISNDLKDGEYLALEAPCYVPIDEVVQSMKKQIVEYLNIYEKAERDI